MQYLLEMLHPKPKEIFHGATKTIAFPKAAVMAIRMFIDFNKNKNWFPSEEATQVTDCTLLPVSYPVMVKFLVSLQLVFQQT